MNKDKEKQIFGLLSEAYSILLGDTHKRITLKEQDLVLKIVQDARMIILGNTGEKA